MRVVGAMGRSPRRSWSSAVNYQQSDTGPTSPPPPGFPVPALILKHLPGTGAEAEAVADMFRRLVHGEVEQITGTSNQESPSPVPGHRYLHLATHGYLAVRPRPARVLVEGLR